MARKKTSSDTAAMERALAAARQENPERRYKLRLYVAGVTPRSEQAIRNVTALCEKHLAGQYELEVIDLYQKPVLAKGEQIIAAPTLIKELPLPLRRLIGSMSQEEKFLVGLDLKPLEE
ncbi:MAG: circadian clock KaiB family protein [Planctomycetaceae bacterium]|nr:circadian clock KaiB family protein [Planctomycetaceae bacterium]